MKAFKKWWRKLLCSNNENFRIVAELTWRAALEEVLKQIETGKKPCIYTSDILMIVKSWIKEELRIPKCTTCNDTQQIGEEIIHEGRSMGWKECPDCVDKENGE